MDDPDSVVAAVVDRDVVRAVGPDAAKFLQGQISQDVDALAVNTSTWTFVLHPQGKVHSWARITKTSADTFLFDVDGGFGAALVQRLSRFLMRTDAVIEAVEWPCVSVRGVDAPRGSVLEGVLRLPLANDRGYDLIGPGAAIPDGVREVDAAVIDARRIVDGIPAMGRELTDATMPAEIGQWIIDASVSFTKGCYVGQELVARVDSRGNNVPRNLRALVTDGPVSVGDPVEANGPASDVTSFADTAYGPVALAMVSRKTNVGDPVSIGGVIGIVRELPLCGSAGS